MTDVVRQANGELINPTFDLIDDSDFVFFNGALYFAGNDGTRGNELWRITLTARTSSSTTLSSSLNPSTIGDQVTFTATVTGASPTGTIAFFDSGTPLGTVTARQRRRQPGPHHARGRQPHHHRQLQW